jgi:thiol-disulfide isomerase/thioredoxin
MKKLALLIIVSTILTAGCNLVKGNQTASNSANNSASDQKEYPMMPASVMQNEIQLLEGKTLKLEAYKGKVIIINIWGTWCGPCRMEIPELIKMQDEYRDKGFQVVGLSLGHDEMSEPESLVKSFVTANKINYDIGFFSAEMREGLSKIAPIGAVPTSYLISKDGKIRAVFQGFGPASRDKIRSAVEKAINE